MQKTQSGRLARESFRTGPVVLALLAAHLWVAAVPAADAAAPGAASSRLAASCDFSPVGRARPAPVRAQDDAEPVWKKLQRGMASWYGSAFHDRVTASGEPFDMNELTAAHRTLPFGTQIKVRNPRNNREVVVRVNDRGPFTGGRSIDLSKAAASALGIMNRGTAQVELFIEASVDKAVQVTELVTGARNGCTTAR